MKLASISHSRSFASHITLDVSSRCGNNTNRICCEFNQVASERVNISCFVWQRLWSQWMVLRWCSVHWFSHVNVVGWRTAQYGVFHPTWVFHMLCVCDQRNYNRLIAVANIFYRNSDRFDWFIARVLFLFECFKCHSIFLLPPVSASPVFGGWVGMLARIQLRISHRNFMMCDMT